MIVVSALTGGLVRRVASAGLVAGLATTAVGALGYAVGAPAPPTGPHLTALGATTASGLVGATRGGVHQAEPGLRLLARAVRAEGRTSYSGTEAVVEPGTRGRVFETLRVSHEAGVGTVLTDLSGLPPGSSRANSRVFEPDASPTGAATTSTLRLLQENFQLSVGPATLVADQRAVTVDVIRPDGAVAARVWIDQKNGVELGRALYGSTGQLVESVRFTRVRFGVARWPTTLPPRLPAPAGVSLDARVLSSLPAHGWLSPDRLPTGYVLVQARRSRSSAGSVLHLVYSNGLSDLSLFEQSGHIETGRLRDWRRARVDGVTTWSQPGDPSRLTWQRAGRVYTLVADQPDPALPAAVRDLVTVPGDGFWARLGRGIGKVWAWLDPLR